MSATRSLLILFCCATICVAALQSRSPAEVRLLFVGDILLSRQVRAQLEQTRRFPWQEMQGLFGHADWIGGNLEGSVGDAKECLSATSPCFDIRPESIKLLAQAGFRALSVENNHAGDLGEQGRETTRRALVQLGILALRFQDAPAFLRFGDYTLGVVAISLVDGQDGHKEEVPSVEAGQRIRLARQLSDLVIVSVHWGSELLNWPDSEQRRQAEWLVAQGADIVLGHHPHVVQPMEMISGKPVYFSLGNHLFDQKYPETKEGVIADIRIAGSKVRCGGIVTRTPMGSAIPVPESREAAKYREFELSRPSLPMVDGYTLRPRPSVPADNGGLVIEGLRNGRTVWMSRPAPVVSLQAGRLGGPDTAEMLLSLELHNSPIDGEDGIRPYVYDLGPQGLIARWRGSALAWPLLDAVLLPDDERVVCALHRGDSFVVLDPKTRSTRVAAYRWNGFGFAGVDDPDTINRCRSLFAVR